MTDFKFRVLSKFSKLTRFLSKWLLYEGSSKLLFNQSYNYLINSIKQVINQQLRVKFDRIHEWIGALNELFE